VLSKLMTLELQGIIARQPGNYYSLKK